MVQQRVLRMVQRSYHRLVQGRVLRMVQRVAQPARTEEFDLHIECIIYNHVKTHPALKRDAQTITTAQAYLFFKQTFLFSFQV